jgi:hypothetical protein
MKSVAHGLTNDEFLTVASYLQARPNSLSPQ